jgi:hypothetical protein
MLLSLTPCVDKHGECSLKHNELAQGTDNHHEDENEPDHCSPFCTCQCCQASFYIPLNVSVEVPEAFKIVHYEIAPRFQDYDLFEYFIPPKA